MKSQAKGLNQSRDWGQSRDAKTILERTAGKAGVRTGGGTGARTGGMEEQDWKQKQGKHTAGIVHVEQSLCCCHCKAQVAGRRALLLNQEALGPGEVSLGSATLGGLPSDQLCF